jgi:hypothetical protein
VYLFFFYAEINVLLFSHRRFGVCKRLAFGLHFIIINNPKRYFQKYYLTGIQRGRSSIDFDDLSVEFRQLEPPRIRLNHLDAN